MGLGLEGANAAHDLLINQLPTCLMLARGGALVRWCGGAAPAAIVANGASFSTNLGSERFAMLRNSIPGTLRRSEGASDPSPCPALPSPLGDWGLIRRQVSIGMPWAPAIARHPACPTGQYWSY